MPSQYFYDRAELTGPRFSVWLAKLLGVKPKLFHAELSSEEAKNLRKKRPIPVEGGGLQNVLPNGNDHDPQE
jgi:hypothetical protein